MPRGSVGDRRDTFPILSLSGSVEYCRFAIWQNCVVVVGEKLKTVVTVEDTVVVLIG